VADFSVIQNLTGFTIPKGGVKITSTCPDFLVLKHLASALFSPFFPYVNLCLFLPLSMDMQTLDGSIYPSLISPSPKAGSILDINEKDFLLITFYEHFGYVRGIMSLKKNIYIFNNENLFYSFTIVVRILCDVLSCFLIKSK
jgi:hypothetical protein